MNFLCIYVLRNQLYLNIVTIRLVIKLKLLCEILKNEKFLLDIQTKCGDITNEILNAAIDAERTFKCKWPKKAIKRLSYSALCGWSGAFNFRVLFGKRKNAV